ncbi:hypothetical protein Q0F99_07310 [Rathayibacter oskolensis]|uniref:hypothetical protein n=1 Tax=Rathayibacter oskolensis TaxID=1891671 RepID=UPI00265FE289|nr:hypothetical protein [Rathayibacter oskolensis]WKK72719.1 hypothetical protein Q0F99_07310 [Rathayibacter oskolensis]
MSYSTTQYDNSWSLEPHALVGADAGRRPCAASVQELSHSTAQYDNFWRLETGTGGTSARRS